MSVTVTRQDLGTKLNGHIAGLSEIYVEVIKLGFRDCPTQIVTGKLTERYTSNTEGERERKDPKGLFTGPKNHIFPIRIDKK